MTTPSAPRPGHALHTGAPDAPAVSVVLAPQQSVLALLLQAASGQSWGAPAGLLPSVRDALRPQARFAAQSFTTPGWTPIPEACAPLSPMGDASVAEQVARIRDLPATALTRELEAGDNGDRHWPTLWRIAGDQPRRWLKSMADASLDTWTVTEPRWRAAGPLLDREIRRIGTAAVRGTMTALLNSLHPGLSYHDATFTYAPPCNPVFARRSFGPVGMRRLALLPMIAGRNALLFGFERPDICYIGYPLRQPRPSAPTRTDGTLATILGPVRAAMLQALRQPRAAGDLAAAVHCAPNTATYHLRQLTATGLITREKSGRSVWISRTSLGDELVDLLSD
jgi:DNA-binding transcriptional ArsR family regulator